MWDKRAPESFLKALSHLKYGQMSVTTPDGVRHDFSGNLEGATGHLRLFDWRVIPAFAIKGDIGFAEAYRDGWWDADGDLTGLLLVGLQNEETLEEYLYGSVLSRVATRFLYLFSRNTVRGSRRNIHAHYDLGNAFYQLWLDPSMSYSSALYAHNDEPLQQAQYNKYDRMLERLETSSGKLLEVGCGWGGLAERAIQNHDFDVTGITISNEQHTYATNRLQGNAAINLQDYRKLEGKFDHLISIEMFEAVGESFWSTYFNKMSYLLKDKGKAVIQTITIKDEFFDSYRKGGDMVRSFIFPGGMLPSPSRFKQEAAKAGLQVTDQFAFGKDYAKTLQEWKQTFDAKLPEVRALGFDEPFIRIWKFYLASCQACFEVGRTNVMQMELQHAA